MNIKSLPSLAIVATQVAATHIKSGGLPHVTADQSHLITLLNIVLSVVGGLSLLMITIGGFRYITAAGNEQKTAKAKSSIAYALIGLVVAIMAESIVLFVGKRLLTP